MSSIKTRASTVICPIAGNPTKFNRYNLPKIDDVMREVILTQHNLMDEGMRPDIVLRETLKLVVEEICTVWKKTAIPIITEQRISALIRHYHQQRLAFLKRCNSDQATSLYMQKVDNFISKWNALFDIAKCKCKEFHSCICDPVFRVSKARFTLCKQNYFHIIKS